MKARLDNHDREIARIDNEVKVLREAKHDHNGRIHTVEAVLVGMKEMINDFVASAREQSLKTAENTAQLRDINVRADTFLKMMKWFFVFCGMVGTIGGSKLFGWW